MSEIITAFGINWKLLVIQMVNFGVLLIILFYFLYKPILTLLDERREKINKGLLDAEEAEIKIKKIEEEREVIINASHTEGEKIVIVAKARAMEQEKSLTQSAEEKRDKILSDAEAKAHANKDRILSESKNELARIATLSAARILEEK